MPTFQKREPQKVLRSKVFLFPLDSPDSNLCRAKNPLPKEPLINASRINQRFPKSYTLAANLEILESFNETSKNFSF
jgi:hypothetical protein